MKGVDIWVVYSCSTKIRGGGTPLIYYRREGGHRSLFTLKGVESAWRLKTPLFLLGRERRPFERPYIWEEKGGDKEATHSRGEAPQFRWSKRSTPFNGRSAPRTSKSCRGVITSVSRLSPYFLFAATASHGVIKQTSPQGGTPREL